MSALLHALSALNSRSTFRPGTVTDDDNDDVVPITSQPCVWKAPRKRKESMLQLSDATFEKHDYMANP